jgi:hypothetical protein
MVCKGWLMEPTDNCHDTLLDATNSVNTALSGMFVPMVSASPAGQLRLAVN